MKIDKIALDIDGVLANFSKSACKACGVEYPQSGLFDDSWLDELVGDKLYARCRGEVFWANLEIYPWAQQIVEAVDSSGIDWRFITKPMQDPGSYSGKYLWIKKHFPKHAEKLWIINGSKAFACDGPNSLLIDDMRKNLDAWANRGGSVYEWKEVTPDWPTVLINKRIEDIKDLLK